MPDLTVITATWKRPDPLRNVLLAVKHQLTPGFELEHLVVSDGRDPVASTICANSGAIYRECAHVGLWGAGAKDYGIAHAAGAYVCFFDDDNHYFPGAAAMLYEAARDHDIGVARCRHHPREGGPPRTIPARPGRFALGDIDTMCVCVRTEVARRALWADHKGRGTDFHWLRRLRRTGASVRFVADLIGDHL